jgi:hypothetical protein
MSVPPFSERRYFEPGRPVTQSAVVAVLLHLGAAGEPSSIADADSTI